MNNALIFILIHFLSCRYIEKQKEFLRLFCHT